MGETMMHDLICNGIAEKAKEENKPCKYFNKLFREFDKSLLCDIKMRKRFGNVCRRLAWHLFHVLCITKDTKLQTFNLNYCT